MLTDEEHERLTIAIKALEPHIGSLPDFRKRFMEDTVARVNRYGKRAFMSDKQWDILHDIYEDVVGDELP